MKKTRLETVWMMLAASLSVPAPCAYAASYKVDWATVDGGGGDCAGGKFGLNGTVGQPDAGFCTGGIFLHQGGFLQAMQKNVGPRLSMTLSGGDFILTWPDSCPGFVVEGARDVTGPWTLLGSGTVSGGKYEFTLRPPTLPRFFQLRKVCPK